MCSCERAAILKTYINITGCFYQLSCLCVIHIKCVVLGEPLIENTSRGRLWGIKMEYNWTGVNRLLQATSFGLLHQTGFGLSFSWQFKMTSQLHCDRKKWATTGNISHVWVSLCVSESVLCALLLWKRGKNAHVSIIKRWLFNDKNVKQEARLSAFTESNRNRKWWEG